MTAINIKAFRGKVPRTSERLLQPNYAVEALNAKITSGRLDPLRGLALVHTSRASTVRTLYRYRYGTADNWLAWSVPVDVVRSPTAQDSRGRVFFTGDGEPRMTSYLDAIDGAGPYPAAWYVLGVHIPTVAPTLGVTGGAGATESRAYVYTFKTQYDEEGAPSPATVHTAFSNAVSWDLSDMEPPPPNSGGVSGAATVATGIVEVTLDTTRGLAEHEQIVLAGVGGMVAANGAHTILSVEPGNKVRIALTTAQLYTAGGSWARRAPHNTADMKRCIYRTVGTNTDYKLVAEIDADLTSYSDSVAATALGRSLPSLESYTPPKNGHSLTHLANGSLAMLAGNELCLSEQYKPYSWPLANRYAFAGTGVALGAAGNSIIILTDGSPIQAVATIPSAASLASMDTYAPCVAKAGVVDIGGAVVYPSHDGLYLAGPGAVRNLTEALYRIDEWRALQPETFKAAYFDQKYYAEHATADGGRRILTLDTAEPDSITEVDESADCLYANPRDGRLYLAKGKKVYQWDADEAVRYEALWQSMDFQFGAPLNFSCAQVHAPFVPIEPPDPTILINNTALLAQGADAIEGALGATAVGMIPIGGSNLMDAPDEVPSRVLFSLLKAGQVVFARELNSIKPFRLPPGKKSEVYAVQISSTLPIYGVTVAQSMGELGRASL